MNYYSFRYDIENTEDNLKVITQYVEKHGQYMLAIEHGKETGKEHYQGYIQSSKNIETVRRSRPFPSLKGTSYSIAPVRDLEIYQSYLCKENLFIYSNDIDRTNIKPWTDTSRSNTAKDSKVSFLSRIVKQWGHREDATLADMGEFVFEQLVKHCKCFDELMYNRIMTGFICQVSEKYKKKTYKNFFSGYINRCHTILNSEELVLSSERIKSENKFGECEEQ